MVTDAQVRKLMKELSKDGNVSRAALKADMDRKTARRYRDLGCVPSQAKEPRGWRTRAECASRARSRGTSTGRICSRRSCSASFRKACDALVARLPEREATVQYLRILHLAASTLQSDVETALTEVLLGEAFDAEAVKRLVRPEEAVVPAIEVQAVTLTEYDALLPGVAR